jgi:hypothetical protein
MKLQELSNVQTGMKPSEFEELINNSAVEDRLLNINGTMQAACKTLVSMLILLFMHSVFCYESHYISVQPLVSHTVAPVNEAAGKHPGGTPSPTVGTEIPFAEETMLSKCSE